MYSTIRRTMLRLGASACALFCIGALAQDASAAKMKVVASVTDLGSIAAFVGGDAVDVLSIARGNADPHRVEVLPSYMVRVSRADLYLKVGLQLDRWADRIIDGSRNADLVVVDCSQPIQPLERPTTRVDARQGDVHPEGNPHYWLDPRNGAIVAREIATALARLDPTRAELFDANAERFAADAEALTESGRARLAESPTKAILSYHRSWVYFVDVFQLEIAGTLEPVPGVPPTGRHLSDMVELVRARQLRVLLQEPYFSTEAGEFLARETGIRPIVVSPSCPDTKPNSYLDHIRDLVDAIATEG